MTILSIEGHMRDEVAKVTQDEKYWKDRAIKAEKKNKVIIYVDEMEVTSVHCGNENTEVVLMDADDNFIEEDDLVELHKEQTKDMHKMSINKIILKPKGE